MLIIGSGPIVIGQVFKEAGIETGDGDRFVPEIPFAYFSGRGDRARVIEAIAPHLDAQLGEYPVSHIKMGRVAPDPDIHYHIWAYSSADFKYRLDCFDYQEIKPDTFLSETERTRFRIPPKEIIYRCVKPVESEETSEASLEMSKA